MRYADARQIRRLPTAEQNRIMIAAADAVADEYAPGGALNLETDMADDTTVREHDRMLRWFAFDHLPEHLQRVSEPFHRLACTIDAQLERGPERTVALRKLLEAKDAAVRAAIHPGG